MVSITEVATAFLILLNGAASAFHLEVKFLDATTSSLSSSRDVAVAREMLTRRKFGVGLAGLMGGLAQVANAAELPLASQAESVGMQSGLLESRVTENVLSPPPFGLEAPDILYPSWFSGIWKVESVGTEVQAPCGYED